MINIKFLFKRLFDANYKGFIQSAKRVGKSTGRFTVPVLLDIIYCTFKYGSGYIDYETFKMYNMNKSQREKVLTVGKNNFLVKQLNNPQYMSVFEDKHEFNRAFSEFLHRDWIMATEDRERVREFLDRHRRVIVKPLDESCGKGIHIVDTSADSKDAIIDRMIEEDTPLMEELVKQYGEMNRLYSGSVNTVRIITIFTDGIVTRVAGSIRMGRNGNVVDNFNNGGIAVCIDAVNGVVVTDGYDKMRNFYKTHPDTGVELKGFRIPQWDKIVELLDRVGKKVPQVRYVGWDVSINEDGIPLLIEGNAYPGQDVTQYPEMGLGDYETMQKAINK